MFFGMLFVIFSSSMKYLGDFVSECIINYVIQWKLYMLYILTYPDTYKWSKLSGIVHFELCHYLSYYRVIINNVSADLPITFWLYPFGFSLNSYTMRPRVFWSRVWIIMITRVVFYLLRNIRYIYVLWNLFKLKCNFLQRLDLLCRNYI